MTIRRELLVKLAMSGGKLEGAALTRAERSLASRSSGPDGGDLVRWWPPPRDQRNGTLSTWTLFLTDAGRAALGGH